jgi:hypothetical protein
MSPSTGQDGEASRQSARHLLGAWFGRRPWVRALVLAGLFELGSCNDEKCVAGAVRCSEKGVQQCLVEEGGSCDLHVFGGYKTAWHTILECAASASCQALDGGRYACDTADGGTYAEPSVEDFCAN